MYLYKFTILYKDKHVDFTVALTKQEPDKAIEIAKLYIEKTLKGEGQITNIETMKL